MNIAVVDDQKADRDWLIENISEYMQSRGHTYKLLQFESAEQFLDKFIVEQFDIVFLDIYMNGMDGISAAAELRKLDMDCKLVFLTCSPEFLRQGYAFNPCHYLIKPSTKEDFIRAMENCRIKPTVDVPFLTVMLSGSTLRLDTRKILYIDFFDRNTNIHMDDSVLSVPDSFGRVTEPLMTDRRFLLCIKGILVNMDFIAEPEDSVFVLKNGQRLQIAMRNKKSLVMQYRSYLFDSMGGRGKVT